MSNFPILSSTDTFIDAKRWGCHLSGLHFPNRGVDPRQARVWKMLLIKTIGVSAIITLAGVFLLLGPKFVPGVNSLAFKVPGIIVVSIGSIFILLSLLKSCGRRSYINRVHLTTKVQFENALGNALQDYVSESKWRLGENFWVGFKVKYNSWATKSNHYFLTNGEIGQIFPADDLPKGKICDAALFIQVE